jgi:UDP-N-acetylglucosamine acyltransferase
MTKIHPTAIIEDGAIIGDDVEIGPYCLIGRQVTLGDRVRLSGHVAVDGHTSIGEGTLIYPFASIGHPPQHLGYHGEDTTLVIGKNNIIREHVTMNPGTVQGRGETSVGDDGLFMAASHIAHDCKVGNNVVFANNATLGGHVNVGDFVFISGLSAVHQFTRIGRYSFVGGMAGLEGDLIPYGMCLGNRAALTGLNVIGMKRRKLSREIIHALRAAYRMLFAQEGTMQERIEDVKELFAEHEEVMEIIDFIKADSNRPLCTPKADRGL